MSDRQEQTRWSRRDAKRHARVHGMRVSNRSIHVIVRAQLARDVATTHHGCRPAASRELPMTATYPEQRRRCYACAAWATDCRCDGGPVLDGICHEVHAARERTVRCPATRLWVLSDREAQDRASSRSWIECPVCQPVPYRACAGCYGTGWITLDAQGAIHRTIRTSHLDAQPLVAERVTGDATD